MKNTLFWLVKSKPMVLNKHLKVERSGDMLAIAYLENYGCIQNYDAMAGWCDRLDADTQISLYTAIMREPGKLIKFRLNHRTHAKLTKRVEDGVAFIDFDKVKAA